MACKPCRWYLQSRRFFEPVLAVPAADWCEHVWDRHAISNKEHVALALVSDIEVPLGLSTCVADLGESQISLVPFLPALSANNTLAKACRSFCLVFCFDSTRPNLSSEASIETEWPSSHDFSTWCSV